MHFSLFFSLLSTITNEEGKETKQIGLSLPAPFSLPSEIGGGGGGMGQFGTFSGERGNEVGGKGICCYCFRPFDIDHGKKKGEGGGGWMEDELSRRIECIDFLLDHLSLHGSWLFQVFLQNKKKMKGGNKAKIENEDNT